MLTGKDVLVSVLHIVELCNSGGRGCCLLDRLCVVGVCECVLGRCRQSTYQEHTSNEAMVKQHTLTLNSASKLDLPCECICSTCFRKPSNAASFIRGLSPLLIAPGGRRTDIITMVCACVHAFQWSGIINIAFYHLHFAQGYNTIGPNLGGRLRMYIEIILKIFEGLN